MYPSFRFEACWYKWTENKFENNVWISPFLVSAPRRKEKQKPDEIVNEERSEWKYFGALKCLCVGKCSIAIAAEDYWFRRITNFELRIAQSTIRPHIDE